MPSRRPSQAAAPAPAGPAPATPAPAAPAPATPALPSPALAIPAPAPTLSRRHAAGAPSARGLLFTLLGELVLSGDGTAWTSAVLAAFARLGIEEKATRQVLMRTAAAGWLEAEKFGRRTRWRLTGNARRLLTDGAERIYSFTGPAEGWDGRWLLVHARIPESDRRARHVLRTRLSWAGFGSLGAGLWISPHPGREAEATEVLREAGAARDAQVFVATRSGLGDIRVMVAAAWDLGAIEDQYERFIEEFRDPAPEDVLARQVELVHAWRRFPSVDPVLPAELLPARWSGLAAARLFADRHQRWSADARLEWKRLNELG
jgi:phenylacetic acid degradation operon negative regulatory protein